MSKNVTEDGIGKALVFFCAKECLTLPHPIIRNTHRKNQADVAIVLWDRSAFDTHQPECVRHTHLDELYFVHFCSLLASLNLDWTRQEMCVSALRFYVPAAHFVHHMATNHTYTCICRALTTKLLSLHGISFL